MQRPNGVHTVRYRKRVAEFLAGMALSLLALGISLSILMVTI